jgi:hypothetical protein
MQEPTWPGKTLFAVTKSDVTTFQPQVRQLYIGTAGSVSVRTNDGVTVVFKDVPQGSVIGPFFITRVNSTGTTAADIVAFV